MNSEEALKEIDRNIALCASETRAGVLVEMAQKATVPQARKLLREWFNACDALAPWRDELREQFVRVGFVTDTKKKLTLPVTVYRAAWEDDDVARSLSWTTERAVAERFCRGLVSMRARFLGIYRDDIDPVIWQATCHKALGYFTSRDESEVIPAVLTGIEPIARLERVARHG